MTREEREDVIKFFEDVAKREIGNAKYNRLAIEALEQEHCDDAISRILKKMWNCRGEHTTSIDKVKMEQIIRDELPSVKPQEPKTGHWIATEDGFECSECGCISRSRADFCQYCRAKMQTERYKNWFQPKSNEKPHSLQQDYNEEVAKAFQLGFSFGFIKGLKEI